MTYYDEKYYELPNQATIERANTFYFKHLLLADKELDIAFDKDVLGGIALLILGIKLSIWISFLNNGNDTVVIIDNGRTFSYELNNNSTNIIKEYISHTNNISLFRYLIRKITSLFG